MGLHLSRHLISLCWAGIPDQHDKTGRLYDRMRKWCYTTIILSTATFRAGIDFAATAPRRFPAVPTFDTRAATVHVSDLRKSARVRLRLGYFSCFFLDNLGPVELPLTPARYVHDFDRNYTGLLTSGIPRVGGTGDAM